MSTTGRFGAPPEMFRAVFVVQDLALCLRRRAARLGKAIAPQTAPGKAKFA